jgi:hypothetical protein
MREGRARFYGLMRCGLAWACPVCRSVIQAERANEITQVVEWHRDNGGEGYLLTLTLRHGVGDDLKRLRRGVADAWRRMQGGRQWLSFKLFAQVEGTVRALETTHGAANGWHPHIHVLILAKKASPETVELWRSQLSVRWQRAIELTLGREHLPSDRRGCDLRPSRQSDYLAKLGLELAGTSAKDGRDGNRSPLEIGAHYAETRDLESAALWRTYAKGMKRARMLTWSRGLRAAAGLGRELTDEEIVAEEEKRDDVQMIVSVGGFAWDRLVRVAGAAVRALELAESHGAEAAVRWMEEATGPPSQSDTLRDRFG